MSDDDKFGKGFLDELESMSGGTEKKAKKGNSVDEVENLLKTTLSEVGIDAEKLRASVKALEAEKQKDKEQMDKLDDLLEPIQHPPKDTAHKVLQDTAHKVLHETAHKPVFDTHAAPLHESSHDVLRQTSRGLERDTVHEPAHPPLHETQKENKDILFGRSHEKAEIFEKPKPSEKDIFPPMPDKKGAARPAPIQRERLETPAKKADGALFDSYTPAETPKKKFPMAAVIIAAVVVIGGASAALLLSKGKPAAGPETKPLAANTANTAVTQPLEEAANDPAATPAEKPAETKPAPVTTPAPKTQANKPPAAKIPAAEVITQTGQAEASQGAPMEPIQPLVPVQTPRVQDVKLAAQTNAADNAPAAKPAAQPAAEAPKKAKLGDLIPLDQVDTQPSVLQRVEAIYPPLGRRFGIEGTVTVNALVSETGDVIRTNVLRKIQGGGTYGFEKASEDAVKKWKFKPAVKDGVNVKTWMPVGVVFRK